MISFWIQLDKGGRYANKFCKLQIYRFAVLKNVFNYQTQFFLRFEDLKFADPISFVDLKRYCDEKTKGQKCIQSIDHKFLVSPGLIFDSFYQCC